MKAGHFSAKIPGQISAEINKLGEVISSGIAKWAEVIKANNIPAVN